MFVVCLPKLLIKHSNFILESGYTVLLLLLLLMCMSRSGCPPGFWNMVDWRALVKVLSPLMAKLRGWHLIFFFFRPINYFLNFQVKKKKIKNLRFLDIFQIFRLILLFDNFYFLGGFSLRILGFLGLLWDFMDFKDFLKIFF